MEGETTKQYIMQLYRLVENCNYDKMMSEMIRDRFVVSIKDNSLSKCLRLNTGLTLEIANKTVQQHETVHEQQQHLLNGEPGPPATQEK